MSDRGRHDRPWTRAVVVEPKELAPAPLEVEQDLDVVEEEATDEEQTTEGA